MTVATLDALTPARNALCRRQTARFGSFAAALVAAILAACTGRPSPRVEMPQVLIDTLGGRLAPATWADMSGWTIDDLASARPALQPNCQTMKYRADWPRVCTADLMVGAGDPIAIRVFFEDNFTPYRVAKEDGVDNGLITDYYESLLRGPRTRHGACQMPLYRTSPA